MEASILNTKRVKSVSDCFKCQKD